jgi:lipopolysaccharide transport system permease protein
MTENQHVTSAIAASDGIVLPFEPVVRIRPGRLQIDLGELWAYRDLFYFLAWRDIKVRYRQTFLGAAWAILQPLLGAALFTVLFGRLAKMPSDGVPYPVFAYTGLVLWTYFSNAISASGNSLVSTAYLLTKVYFPRIIIPAAAVLAATVDVLVALLPLGGFVLAYQIPPRWSWLLVLPILVVTGLVATAGGSALSALNVKYRDVRHVLPFALQLWMFASPVFYPLSLLPERWRPLLWLNPLTGLLEGLRAALFGTPLQAGALIGLTLAMVVGLPTALLLFRRVERGLADIV